MKLLAPALALLIGLAAGFLSRPTVSRLYRSHHTPPAADLTIPREPDNPLRHMAVLRNIAGVHDIPAIWLGDSITEGWRDSPDLWARYCPSALNHGAAWDRVEHTHWRIANGELGHAHPAVVVAMIGTNNISRGDPPDAIAAGVRALLAAIRDRLPDARILLLGVLPRSPATMMPVVRELNRRLAELAGDRVCFLDVGDRFLVDGEVDLSLLPDGVHPSPEGYEVLGEAIESRVRP
jgi:lysophospholipase L1-like esterase